MNNKIICECCTISLVPDSEYEMQLEAKNLYPTYTLQEMSVVCHDCFIAITEFAKTDPEIAQYEEIKRLIESIPPEKLKSYSEDMMKKMKKFFDTAEIDHRFDE